MRPTFFPLPPADRHILRCLAKRVLQISQDPIMAERKRLWYQHDALASERPMILLETSGVIDEVISIASLQCSQEWTRKLERQLRNKIYYYECINDDSVVEPYMDYNWIVTISDYGVAPSLHKAETHGKLGSYSWDPPIKDLDGDFDALRYRQVHIDHERTLAYEDILQDLFDGILTVRRRGAFWWTMGLTWQAINLLGLEGFMLAMYDNPQGLHRLMAFLRDDHQQLIEWFEKEALLTLNNEDDYIGSGGIGYTRALPAKDWAEDDSPVRLRDLWCLSESQETVGVSPEMFAEFVLTYQLPLTERFGRTYYGCCEPLHGRWHYVQQIPNLKRVSISPWCDQEVMAEALGREYVFARKPNPALISHNFNEEEIRQDIRTTLEVANECCLELAMKDVHTVNDEPWRLGRWVAIVREEIDRSC